MKKLIFISALLSFPLLVKGALQEHSLQKHIVSIKNLAETLACSYPADKYRLCCLGQSPAFVVKAIELREKKQQIARCTYLAFSRPTDSTIENPDSVLAYKAYLIEHNLHPAQLLKDFHEKGNKIVIIDFVDTGRSITNFMNFLFDWASERGLDLKSFSNMFTIVLFLQPSKPIGDLIIKGHLIQTHKVYVPHWTLLDKLVNAPDDERMVPCYRQHQFHVATPDITLSEKTTNFLVHLKQSVGALNYRKIYKESDGVGVDLRDTCNVM